MKIEPNRYDLIGDIHGHCDKLVALLERLGYRRHANHYRHPEGRKVIFLGDLIDRGPKVREVLHLVRAMVDAGEALAIMGNHEFNAVCYHTPDGKGGWRRKHSPEKVKQHAATLAAFKNHPEEWKDWLDWMKRLPMFLDLGELRAVHACWDDARLAIVRGRTLLDDDFLKAAATRGTLERDARETLLNGPELQLPDGMSFPDSNGIVRTKARVRWWNLSPGAEVGKLVLPEPMDVSHRLTDDDLFRLPNYPADAPPVFFGHYWMRPGSAKKPLAGNVVCLDFGAGIGSNPLYAYRWNGGKPAPEHFVTHAAAA